ncbi:MAG: hypothetical protein AABY01_00700 [Nanoarchaeota archaeon]
MSLRNLKDLFDSTGPLPVKAIKSHDIIVGKMVIGFIPQSHIGTLVSVDMDIKLVQVTWAHGEHAGWSGKFAYYFDNAEKYIEVSRLCKKAYSIALPGKVI